MAKAILTIVFCTIFCSIHVFFDGDESWFVVVWGNQMAIAVLLFHIVNLTPWKRINERCLFSFALIWQVMDVLTYWPWYFYPDSFWITWPVHVSAMILWFIFIIKRKSCGESTPTKAGNVHICISKPKKLTASIISTVGKPSGSIAIYAYGCLWSFMWSKSTFQRRKTKPENLYEFYNVIDTGVPESQKIDVELRNTLGRPARRWQALWLRWNCVIVLKDVFKAMGNKYIPSGLEVIPSLYARKF